MSLFDVIKYADTNLCRSKDLIALPEELVMIYWDKVAILPKSKNDHRTRCIMLAGWCEFNLVIGMKEKFLATLDEYESV